MMLEPERRDYYVYVIFRPSGEPCYVGKGRGKRWQQHAKKSHNKRLARIYALADGNLPIWKAQDGLTNEEACKTEIALIAALGRRHNKTGVLVNLTAGGDGTLDYILTPEQIEKGAAQKRGKKQTPEWIARRTAHRKGRPASPAQLAVLLARNKAGIGRKASLETRAKLSAAHTGRTMSAEAVEKTAAAHRGAKRSPETRARMRIAAAKRWAIKRGEIT